MGKQIKLLRPGEFGNDEIDSLYPNPQAGREGYDAFVGFNSYDIQRMLVRAATVPSAFVLWVNDAPRSYSTQVIPACPECGRPMRQIRRGATLAKRGPAFVCAWNEYWSNRGAGDEKHEYIRAWSPDELLANERNEAPAHA